MLTGKTRGKTPGPDPEKGKQQEAAFSDTGISGISQHAIFSFNPCASQPPLLYHSEIKCISAQASARFPYGRKNGKMRIETPAPIFFYPYQIFHLKENIYHA
ncbi:MAG: hypothetical protein ACL93V_05215 [Candidatus Electrothrix sp. YB6]